jgi:hypothetical protein
MRIGLSPETARCRLLSEAIRKLESLEREIREAAERGLIAGSTMLESIAKEDPLYFVVAVGGTGRGRAVDWWSVASEQEGRQQALEQSLCHGQRNWSLRVYRGDAVIGVYRQGQERNPIYWSRMKSACEPQVSPSALGAKSYFVFISTDTGVHRDSVVVASKAEAMTYHEAHWKRPSMRDCMFRAYEATPSGQRTLIGVWKNGREIKR